MVNAQQLKKSFRASARGFSLAFRQEQNFRIHIAAGLFVLLCAWLLGLSAERVAILSIAIAAVLSCELANSVIERVLDVFKPRLSPAVADIKDMMASLVLLASITATVVGIAVFFM